MQHWFAYYDWHEAPIIGVTSRPRKIEDYSTPRGGRIQQWIDNTEYDIDQYVILDDEYDGMHGMPLVQTGFNSAGLTYEKALDAYRILVDNPQAHWTHAAFA